MFQAMPDMPEEKKQEIGRAVEIQLEVLALGMARNKIGLQMEINRLQGLAQQMAAQIGAQGQGGPMGVQGPPAGPEAPAPGQGGPAQVTEPQFQGSEIEETIKQTGPVPRR
jgi:hypothetical protein